MYSTSANCTQSVYRCLNSLACTSCFAERHNFIVGLSSREELASIVQKE